MKRIVLLLFLLTFLSGCVSISSSLVPRSAPAITITNGTMDIVYVHLFGERVATLGAAESVVFYRTDFYSILANSNVTKNVTVVVLQPQGNVLETAQRSFTVSIRQSISYQWTVKKRDFSIF